MIGNYEDSFLDTWWVILFDFLLFTAIQINDEMKVTGQSTIIKFYNAGDITQIRWLQKQKQTWKSSKIRCKENNFAL